MFDQQSLIDYVKIIYNDTRGFPDERSISKEMIQDLDIDEGWAWGMARLLMSYRKKNDKDGLMTLLTKGERVEMSENSEEVTKNVTNTQIVVNENEGVEEILLKIEPFTTNDMFIK